MDVKMSFKTVEIILPAGEAPEIIRLEDGRYKVVQMVEEVIEELDNETKLFDGDLILIEAEKLSMNDTFMKYKPKTDEEKEAKKLISEAIKKKVKNFYRPKYDPSFTKDGNGICFISGKKPAVGKSYNWWYDIAKKCNPELNSRLGTRLQYGAFLGLLIKKLIKEGKTVEWAWNAVCNDSRELGHYWNSENAKHDFEPTGSRMICGFYDLANTYKILAEDEEAGGFWLAGGHSYKDGYYYPLADLSRDYNRNRSSVDSVGWLVLS